MRSSARSRRETKKVTGFSSKGLSGGKSVVPRRHNHKHGSWRRRRSHRAAREANADLQPELLSAPAARKLLEAYDWAQTLAAFGVATLARKLDDALELARATGTSVGKAKDTIATGKVLGDSEELSDALRHGDISLDQAAEIATAERSAPGGPQTSWP